MLTLTGEDISHDLTQRQFASDSLGRMAAALECGGN